MPLTVNTDKLRSLICTLFFCFILLPAYSQEADQFDINSLESLLLESLPTQDRVIDDPEDFELLYDDLHIAEIFTTNDLKDLIDTQLDKVLEMEKEICTQMLESEELTATISTGTYSASFEDAEWIKKGIYFTVAGLVRTMIDLTQETDQETSEEI